MRKLSLLHLLLVVSILLIIIFFLPTFFNKGDSEHKPTYLEDQFLESYSKVFVKDHEANRENGEKLLRDHDYRQLFSDISLACKYRGEGEEKILEIQKAYQDLVHVVLEKDPPIIEIIRNEQKTLEVTPNFSYSDLIYLNSCVTLRI